MVVRGRPRAFDRDRALRAAMEVFWEFGYEGSSISQLCAAMGVNAPSLYAAFGSKERLFRDAVALYERQEGLDMPAEGPARDAVAALLRAGALAYTEPDRPSGCLIVLGAITYTPRTEGVRDHLAERRRAQAAWLRERFARAVAEGELPKEADLDALAGYVCAMLAGMSTRARDGAARGELLAVAEAAMAAWDRLAAGEGQRSGPHPGR